jgi:ribonucleoside-diphosphate reductase beta chain
MPVSGPFQTTARPLDADSAPMRLYEKAKRLGIWNPSDIDLTRDRDEWPALTEDQREAILQTTSLFVAGEEAVTVDLLPLVLTIARERRLEEELFLTTFLWEEGKHTQFFRRWLDEVAGSPSDLERFHGESYRTLFEHELPRSMNALLDDPSPAAQVRASVTYNLIVEGVLAETGYHSYFEALEARDLLPGLRRGLYHLKQDESRHIAYGVHLLERLVAADPALWEVVETRMNELLPLTLGIVDEGFARYGDVSPFGLVKDDVAAFAAAQFATRLARIRPVESER